MAHQTHAGRFQEALENMEEGISVGKIPIDKERRGRNSTVNFRAGRGGRAGAKAQVNLTLKMFRGSSGRG